MMTTRLQNGDRFPDLSIRTVGGNELGVPRDIEGSYTVILFYRGAWCPYCKAQLAAFARARASLQSGFVLDKQGRILTAVYSSGAIGRLVPEDVAGFVRYIESRDAAKTPSALTS